MPKPSEKEMEHEMERVEHASGPGTGLPFKEYGKDRDKLTNHIQRLEKEYDEREKVIERIMEYGTGIETEKALRMYPTPVLVEWEKSLENYRAQK
jgi:hypothetical protein